MNRDQRLGYKKKNGSGNSPQRKITFILEIINYAHYTMGYVLSNVLNVVNLCASLISVVCGQEKNKNKRQRKKKKIGKTSYRLNLFFHAAYTSASISQRSFFPLHDVRRRSRRTRCCKPESEEIKTESAGFALKHFDN